MFYEKLNAICSQNGITVSALVKALGLSTSKVTAWKNGTVPKGETLAKIADYLDVSIDYLMGRTDESNIDKQLAGVDFALYSETKDLNETQKKDVLKFVQFLKNKEKL